ncbi:DUF536 domain-containing protein (plasmid) [Staphylococcus aureus]|uniref:DUF536 domain-containing protein n=1 Tax=Staphylococcus aureus TaxID=1280 RepID=UPI0021D37431|nr:DUF536 domain-containing protein [Staphylococcus aureus]UXT64029.1 DUF536 domain-containing protein [Staphylococcus aureus]
MQQNPIFNNIKRLNIETIKQENASFIKEDTDVERIIQRVNENKKKYGFEINKLGRKNNESDKVESENDTQIIEILKNQIDNLNRQIEKQESHHEKTLEFYRKELQERSKLLENQQILALESNKKIQKLENQLEEERHINSPFDISNDDRKNVDVQGATDSVNINQDLTSEIQYENISESQSHENIQGDLSNSNDNDGDIERKNEETQSKKGFWRRLFGR